VFRHAPRETMVRRHPASCIGEGKGRSEEKERENKGDKDFHGEIRLSVSTA
jgi:hypothetical protein